VTTKEMSRRMSAARKAIAEARQSLREVEAELFVECEEVTDESSLRLREVYTDLCDNLKALGDANLGLAITQAMLDEDSV